MPAPDLRSPRMRAAITSSYGAPLSSTAIAQVTRPVVGDLLPGQLLVKVSVASLCPSDAELRSGMLKHTSPLALPAILGSDFSGTVVAIGKKQQHPNQSQKPQKAEPAPNNDHAGKPTYDIGAKVIGRARPQSGDGSCAEYVIVDPSRVTLLPDHMSVVDGAVLPTPACAAYAALVSHARLNSGESVLVFGAASGDGHVAVQIAAALGAARVAAVCSGRDVHWLKTSFRRASRDCQVDIYDVESKSRAAIVEEFKPDVVLDCESSQCNWDAVRSYSSAKTRFVAYGTLGGGMTASAVCGSSAGRGSVLKQKAHDSAGGHTGVEEVGRMAKFSARLVARKAGGFAKVNPCFSIITSSSTEEVSLSGDVAPMLLNGNVKAHVEKKFRLEHIAAAHALIDSGKLRGQLALDIHHEASTGRGDVPHGRGTS
jgi:NADPH:quinone reductase-like Zn-dependent oxidoreductase